MESPIPYFSNLQDSRVERTKAHFLEDIIFIAIASVLCVTETWDDMEDFGRSKESWFKTFLQLPEGTPSHDAFNRVFSLLAPMNWEEAFWNGLNRYLI